MSAPQTHDDKSLCLYCNYYDLTFRALHQAGCKYSVKSVPHTPGPWQAERHGVVTAMVNGHRRQVASVQGDAVMHSDPSLDVVELQRANAALIAAAPRLLAALENLCNQVRESKGMDTMEARMAIAAAKGEP